MSFDQSAFDPALFLAQETTEAATKRPPLDIGDYTGVISELIPRTWQSKDGSKSGLALDIKIAIEVPAEQQASKHLESSMTLRDSVFLDTNGGGLLDWTPGKNRGLRNYREATGTNVSGQPFSPAGLVGRAVRVKINHKILDGGDIVEEISGVAKA